MTKVINLDDLSTEPPVRITIGGKTHDMKVLTMQDLIDNLKTVEELGMNPGVAQELEAGVKIIGRAFPTLKESQIRNLPVDTLQQLIEIARGGTAEVAEEGEEGNGKPAS